VPTSGGFTVTGQSTPRVPLSGGGGKPLYLNISHSWITFNRIPMPGDSSFGTSVQIVNDQSVSVDTPGGDYYVSDSVPNGAPSVPSSGNTGVGAEICGQ
jgi:hypothetical protein